MPSEIDKHQLMRTFCTVIKVGSFKKAADYLGLPASSVSKNIKRLEHQLRTQLIVRNTRSMSLTDAGTLYFEKGNQILKQVDELELAVQSIKSVNQGKLRVSLPINIGEHILMPLISEFITRHPEIKFELDFSHDTSDLIAEDFDIAFRTNAFLPDSAFFETQLLALQSIYVASPEYLVAHGTPTKLAELSEHQSLAFMSDIKSSKRLSLMKNSTLGEVRLLSNNYKSLIMAAKTGCGIANVYDVLVREELQNGSLVQVLNELALPEKNLSILYRQRENTSRKIQSFITFMKHSLNE